MSRAGESGSSVVEALASAVIISVGVLALALLTGGIVRGNRDSDRLSEAVLAAGDRLEGILAGVPLSAWDLDPGAHPPDQLGAPRYEALDHAGLVVASSVPVGPSPYRLLRRWVVQDEASARCLRRVRVSVHDPREGFELATAEGYVNCP